MLTRKNDAPLDFDFDKVLEQSKDNPVFYVQYAHARIRSVLRKARRRGSTISDAALAADLSSSPIRRNWRCGETRRMAAAGGDRGAHP
jgi:arginyl-tRNA synthetase